MLRFTGSGDIKVAVRDYFESRDDLGGKIVVDLPAGKGRISELLASRGAIVEAFDLFPEFFEVESIRCNRADLGNTLPIADRHADLVLCQEAIEHLADQLHALRELNRILKPDGELLLTTPNVSHLRARLSWYLVEGELYNRLPANEIDAVWFAEGGRSYFGHLFLVGIQRLRVLARLAGFRIERLLPVKVSASSLLLGITWPALALTTWFARRRTSARLSEVDPAIREPVLAEIARLNLHPTVLFGKHLFVALRKVAEHDAVDLAVHKDTRTIC